MKKYIKLSTYAENNDICYMTAFRHFKKGMLKGYQNPDTGSIFIEKETSNNFNENEVILYAWVSSSENKSNLESQLDRLRNFSIAKGYTIKAEYKEIGSGLNDNRKVLNKILNDRNYSKIIIEHKDRLTRFGFNYLEILLSGFNIQIEVINFAENKQDDLMQDFISIITSFCARIYGNRRSKRKTENIIQELNEIN